MVHRGYTTGLYLPVYCCIVVNTMNQNSWSLERVLFALAGTMTLLSVALVLTISSWFLLLTAFVGVNQWLYVVFGACPASLVLSRFTPLRPCGAQR